MIEMGVHDPRRGRSCTADPVLGTLRFGGKVCDLPGFLLDRLAREVAKSQPRRLAPAQRQVDESAVARALRGGER